MLTGCDIVLYPNLGDMELHVIGMLCNAMACQRATEVLERECVCLFVCFCRMIHLV